MSSNSNEADMIYKMQADLCAALAHPIRIQIIDLLGDGELNCSEILNFVNISKANLSQHIQILKKAGIIESRREGNFQYIYLTIPQIKEACSTIKLVLLNKFKIKDELQSKLIKQLKKSVI